MIDLTEITETIAHEKYERTRAKYPEEGFAAWEDLDLRVKTNFKQQVAPSIHRIAEVVEQQVREQIAAEIEAAALVYHSRSGLLGSVLRIVRGDE